MGMANVGLPPDPSTRTQNRGEIAGIAGPGGIGGGQVGSFFGSLFGGRAPGANIQAPTVATPNRGDFGTPGAAPTITDPTRAAYGTPDRGQLDQTAAAAESARKGFEDPTGTSAFKNIMGGTEIATQQALSAEEQQAKDAAQRRGYAGGFEDTARAAGAQRMQALAQAGFAGAQAVQEQEGAQYGRAIGAYAQMQDSYNQAMTTGNVAYAHDLTNTHIANAENMLKTMELNQNQQLAYAGAITQAKELQAQLNEAFNKDLIDNARFVSMNQQIAASLMSTMMGLQEKQREFDVGAKQFEETRSDKELAAERGLRASGKDFGGGPLNEAGGVFTGIA